MGHFQNKKYLFQRWCVSVADSFKFFYHYVSSWAELSLMMHFIEIWIPCYVITVDKVDTLNPPGNQSNKVVDISKKNLLNFDFKLVVTIYYLHRKLSPSREGYFLKAIRPFIEHFQ